MGQPNLNTDIIGNTYVTIPPKYEQQKIVDFLDVKCAEIDDIIADKKKQLETLKQYKKSLIYEYVTGKKEVPDNEWNIDWKTISTFYNGLFKGK